MKKKAKRSNRRNAVGSHGIPGGDKKPAPGSTGSADLDKAIDRAKILVAEFAVQLGGAIK